MAHPHRHIITFCLYCGYTLDILCLYSEPFSTPLKNQITPIHIWGSTLGLIEFIESSVFSLANRIAEDEADGRRQADKLLEMLLAFAEKNPGMVRVMTGDALVGEHERLQTRMNQFYDRFEATLKQALRAPGESGQKPSDAEVSAHAGMLVRYALGCLHQYAKSGFTKKPTESLAAQRRFLAA